MEVHLGSSFRIRIDGIGEASFARCRGIGARTEVVAVPEGGAPGPRLLPGDVAWDPIVLERGWVRDHRLWEWFESHDPRGGSVEILTPDGEAAGRWSFSRAWPSRWSGPSFDAGKDEIALEVLEVVHEGLRWEGP
jgi:phage tail-like protein